MKQLSNGAIISLILIMIIIWNIADVVKTKGIGFGVETGAKNAADFFIQNNIKGPIFNNFDIGSYLEYRLYPKEKTFIDGRPEAYPADFIQSEYIQAQINSQKFEEIIKKYKINSIFFSYIDQTPWANEFIKRIVYDKGWRIIYVDDYIFILVKNTNENKNLIKKYAMDINTIKLSNIDSTNKISLIRTSLFFIKTDQAKQAENIYQKILNLDPNDCFAIGNLSVLLYQEGSPLSGSYSQKYQQLCQ